MHLKPELLLPIVMIYAHKDDILTIPWSQEAKPCCIWDMGFFE